MLHSTTYNLNSSYTKQIIAGAEFRKDDNLNSISFNLEEWKLFKSYFNLISSYFDGQVKQQCIECGNFRMHLTVSFGDYIVALEQSQEAEVANR